MEFNIPASVECGQIFRWTKEGNTYYLTAKDSVFELQVHGKKPTIENSALSDSEMRKFLGLNHNLENIYKRINKDRTIKAAIKKYEGLRVFEQDAWEALMAYICSSNSSIPNINAMAENLSKKFGKKMIYKEKTFYTYPKPETIAKAKLADIIDCKLGFRAKYLLETAKKVASGEFDIKQLEKMPHKKAREVLATLPGVGYKIADCVSLFGLQNFESFPVDVWTKRVMSEYYGVEKFEDIWNFAETYFGKYAGYAQEYLFYHRRTL